MVRPDFWYQSLIRIHMNNLEFLVSNLTLVRSSGRVDFASEQFDF